MTEVNKHIAFAVAQFMQAARSHKHGMAALIVAGAENMIAATQDGGKLTPTRAAATLADTFVSELHKRQPLADSTIRNYTNWSERIVSYGLRKLEVAGVLDASLRLVATQAEYDALLALHEAACNDALANGDPKPEWAAPLVAETIIAPLGNALREMSDGTDPKAQEKRDAAKAKREKEKAEADAAKAQADAAKAATKADDKASEADAAAQAAQQAEARVGDTVQGPDYDKVIGTLLQGIREGTIDRERYGQALTLLADAVVDYLTAPVADAEKVAA